MKPILFFLGTLAVSLIGSAALAEKGHPGGGVDRHRARGEVVDRASHHPAREAQSRPMPAARSTPQVPGTAASRVRCSESGLDCPTRHRASKASEGGSRTSPHGELPALPGRLAKALGSDRTAINEAGEDQGMSKRAANRVWARAAAGHASSDAAHGGRLPALPGRLAKALGSDRTAINEAGEDQGMSKRAANRVWARAAKAEGQPRVGAQAQKEARPPKP
jgi:hypothetical protein